MIVKDFYLRNDQWRFLRSLPGKASEHVRAAIDDYKLKKDKEKSNSSQSLSVSLTQNGGSSTDKT
jgi:hypothetical protein